MTGEGRVARCRVDGVPSNGTDGRDLRTEVPEMICGTQPPVETTLYVANLGDQTSVKDLQEIFEPYGAVQFVQLMMQPETDHSEVFGVIEMADAEEAQAAIDGLNGREAEGHVLSVMRAPAADAQQGTSRVFDYIG
jgi:RNA recognition motif-containing protein